MSHNLLAWLELPLFAALLFILEGDMSRDPAFLFYDGDAARDVSHMNRLERGCYFDLIQAQRKFGGFTVEQAKKILGKDFDTCWESLTLILSKQDDLYLIEWIKESTIKRKENARSE